MHEQLNMRIMTLENIIQQLNARLNALEQFIVQLHTSNP